MNTRTLGENLAVSSVELGCMGYSYEYGAAMEEKEAEKGIRSAFDMGCTFFDTAEDSHHTRRLREVPLLMCGTRW